MYRWAEHTSELELRLEAGSEEGVLAEAVAALGELLTGEDDRGEGGGASAAKTVELDVEAPDAEALLASWAEEIVYLAESRSLIPLGAEGIELGGEERRRTASGRLSARAGEPRPLVKAVTYHRLRFEHDGEGWQGRLVLDV